LKKHYLLPGIEEDYVDKGKTPNVKKASVLRVGEIASRVAMVERVAQQYVEDVKKARMVYECIDEMMPKVYRAYREVMGSRPKLRPIMIGINNWDLPEGKIGSFKFPDNDGNPGLLTVSPEAFDEDGARYWWVVTHELIHVLLGKKDISRVHGEKFQEMADKLGIPEKYRD